MSDEEASTFPTDAATSATCRRGCPQVLPRFADEGPYKECARARVQVEDGSRENEGRRDGGSDGHKTYARRDICTRVRVLSISLAPEALSHRISCRLCLYVRI